MKYLKITTILILFTLGVNAQKVTYKMVEDNPLDIRNFEFKTSVLFGFGGWKGSNDIAMYGGLDFNASYFPLLNRIGLSLDVERYAKKSEGLRTIDEKNPTKIELTGSYALISNSKKKKRTLILSSTSTTYTTTTKSIITPQTRTKNFEVVGGIMSYSGSKLNFHNEVNNVTDRYNVYSKSKGLIGGIQFRSFSNYKALINNKYYRTNSNMFIFYVRGMYLPIHKLDVKKNGKIDTDFDKKDIKDLLKEKTNFTPLGAVAGVNYTLKKSKLITMNVGFNMGMMAPSSLITFEMDFGLSINIDMLKGSK